MRKGWVIGIIIVLAIIAAIVWARSQGGHEHGGTSMREHGGTTTP